MPTSMSGTGDPARTLLLLWRQPLRSSRRGPQQGLAIDSIVQKAIAVADAEGLDAVTMRRLAQELGVAAMTLYTYVPGKAELLDLMLDYAYIRMPRTPFEGKPWRARLEAVASDNRSLFATHPWAATISTVRPPLGPGALGKYEHELAAVDGTVLDDVEMDAALTLVLQFVRTAALAAEEVHAAEQLSRRDDEQWWAANQPLLSRIMDPSAYPLATRVGTAAGQAHGAAFHPDHAYSFGLGRILDGLANLIDRGAAGRRSS
ncbi:MAG TPA: TetR/AcrR family transcriptional regulator [Jiangellaceae bacterium]